MRSNPGIVTLTTDFGLIGSYVAAIKGIILGMAPTVRLVDVSHTIRPQNILEGAVVLADLVDVFPQGTVHLAVVDPGVGTDRPLIVAAIAGCWFVLPDNGLITGAARGRAVQGTWEITNPALRRGRVSPTFHGRDILAPAAAYLARGGDPAELGPVRNTLVTLRNFEPDVTPGGVLGAVLFADTFGNLITNVDGARLGDYPAEAWSVEVAGNRIDGLLPTYGVRPAGSVIALVGSSGRVEIAVVNGNAAQQLAAGPGTPVRVRRPS